VRGAFPAARTVQLIVLDFLKKTLLGDPELPGRRPAPAMRPGILPDGPMGRASNGLRHFFDNLPQGRVLEVLDLGGINEANIGFLSELGGKIHAVDLLECFDRSRRENPDTSIGLDGARRFIDEYLNFPRNQFDAILVWDALEFLDSDVLHLTVPRLGEILRPGGALLSFFHNESRGQTVQVHRYRIEAVNSLKLEPRQLRTLPNTFNNRSLERLFGDFDSVKFFLTRDHLREVIVSR